MPQSLYTPFAGQMMGNLVAGKRQADVGKAMKGAYMGAPGAMENLMQLDPESGMKVQQYQAQQQQQDLQNQQRARTEERLVENQARDFAEKNHEVMQGLAEEISYFDNFEDASAYNETQRQQLIDLYGEEAVPDISLTPEKFEQIKQVYVGQLGKNQETVGSPYMIEGEDDDGNPIIQTAVAVRDKKRGGVREVILEGATARAHAIDPRRAGAIAGAKKTATIEAEINLEDERVFSKLRSDAKAKLRPARLQAQQTLKSISSLRDHPGREEATGLSNWIDPRNYVAGTDAYDFSIQAGQLQGQIFAEAYKTLKGGGTITEIESEKASSAIARMKASASEPEFLRGLDDFEDAVRDGYQLMLDQARTTPDSVMENTSLEEPHSLNNPAKPTSKEELDALPSGSYFLTPNGETRRKR